MSHLSGYNRVICERVVYEYHAVDTFRMERSVIKMKRWNYAELSRVAKVFGGPEALMVKLIQSGRKQMIPAVVGSGVVGVGIGLGMPRVIRFFSERNNKEIEEVKKAKEELVNGIKEYDAMNSPEEVVADEEVDSVDE